MEENATQTQVTEVTETASDMAQLSPQAEQTDVAQPEVSAKPKTSVKQVFAEYFTATRIAYMALFTALSFVLYLPWLEFYIIPAVSFLKVDFSNTFVLIAGFSLGPVAGIIVSVLKEVLHIISGFSSTGGVGELANIIVTLPFILIPTIGYKYKKGIKWVLIFIALGCLAQVIWSFPVNWLLNFPVFIGFNWELGMSAYIKVWYWAMLFNLVKCVMIAAASMLLYKQISRLIKYTNQKLTKKKPQVANDNSSR